jgi:hypothetical protein
MDDEKIFEQPEDTQEPSPDPSGADEPEQERAEIREAEEHGEERNPPGEIPPTGTRGSWT